MITEAYNPKLMLGTVSTIALTESIIP